MKVALVTGGSGGIGAACAAALAADGWSVAVGFRGHEDAGKETLRSVEEAGADGLLVPIDVADEESVAAAFREVNEGLGPVTGLVNAAGISRDGLALKYSAEAFDETMSVNVRGAFLCSRAALRAMVRARWGRIVNVSSVVALQGNPGQTAYAASKAALVGMTKTLAREMGGKGVTVNAVCPGLIETDMAAAISDAARSRFVTNTPAGRLGMPEEVASVVRFVMSDEASYVNGAVVAVDGGLTA